MNKAFKLITMASVLGSIISGASANLIVNGDFEAGNTAFNSDYTFSPTDYYPEGMYAVDRNPNLHHGSFASYGDHTYGEGMMLIVNGAVDNSKSVWNQDITLSAGQDYVFTGWTASCYPASPAKLDMKLGGNSIGTVDVDSSTTWMPFSIKFTAGSSGPMNLSMVDLNGEPFGNDFTVDDLSVEAVPEPASIAAVLIGSIGLVRRRARK